jgi:hypothetical protein
MSDGWFYIGFFVVLVILSLTIGQEGKGIFSDYIEEAAVIQTDETTLRTSSATLGSTQSSSPSSQASIEEDAFQFISLSVGDVVTTNPDFEYLILDLSADAPQPLTLTSWSLESKREDTIVIGEPITLSPGESVVVVSGAAPSSIPWSELAYQPSTVYLNQRNHIWRAHNDSIQLRHQGEPIAHVAYD